jgi:hypothetical protein
MYEESLYIRKITVGEKNSSYSTTLYNIGILHKELTQFSKACESFEQALYFSMQEGDDNNPE